MKQWLYYANSIRLGSAMGGPDNASFQTGWFDLTTHLREMQEWVDTQAKLRIPRRHAPQHGAQRLRHDEDSQGTAR